MWCKRGMRKEMKMIRWRCCYRFEDQNKAGTIEYRQDKTLGYGRIGYTGEDNRIDEIDL